MQRKAEKIWNPALFGIRNLLSRNPESTGWNPESKTVMDSLTWGDPIVIPLIDSFCLTAIAKVSTAIINK